MIIEENGMYKLFSGDTGTITIDGFDTEHNYRVYLQFSDEDGNFIGNQLYQDTNYSDQINVFITSTVSDALIVPIGEDYVTYYLGGKKTEIVPTYQYLYAWTYDGNTVYTHTVSPTTSSKVYTASDVETELVITAVTTVNDEVTAITISSNDYTRDTEEDTKVVKSTVLSGEDTIIPAMGQKKPVIVYRKVAEGQS